MKLQTRAVLINVSVIAGLLIMFYTGSRALPVLISGVFLLIIANVAMVIKARSKP
jgi:hypothetical protein